ncbi:MAG: LamG domain-containing protein [Fibrobacteria bacterium]|nr:LamG domain-containing protein [Fibrobacteria bacterium]
MIVLFFFCQCGEELTSGTSSETKNTLSLAKINMNTTDRGENFWGMAFNYPLLVRLDTNYDFSRCGGSGKNIEFFKNDTVTPLPFEIELWDSAASRAAIWVKLDTLKGQDSVQHIFMRCYDSEFSTSLYTKENVFSPTNGFSYVLHMDQDTVLNQPEIIRQGNMGELVSSLVGEGVAFDGEDDFLSVPDIFLQKNDPVTVSGWFQVSDVEGSYTLASLYNPELSTSLLTIMVNGNVLEIIFLGNTTLASFTGISPNTWHYLSFVLTGNGNISLYIDGDLVITTAIVQQVPGFGYILLGHSNNGKDLMKGIVDELRVSSVSRSAEWIKLNYRNQMKDSHLVTLYAGE